MALFGLYKSRKERAREEEQIRASELEQKLETQRQLGVQLNSELSSAATQNRFYPISVDGRTTRNGQYRALVKPQLLFDDVLKNDEEYSVIVRAQNQTVLQAHINMGVKGIELHVFNGYSRLHEYHSISEFAGVKDRLVKYVREFNLNPR